METNNILNSLYENRSDIFEKNYIHQEEFKDNQKKINYTENLLLAKIDDSITDETNKKQILHLLNCLELNFIAESNLCKKHYYKLGLVDKIQFNKEVLKIKKELHLSNDNSPTNCLFYQGIENFFEYFENQLSKRNDYKDLLSRLQTIKSNHPTILAFLDDEKISAFTLDDQKALLEIISIKNDISSIELEEAFRLGQKENSIL